MKRQYHIRQATESDVVMVQQIFAAAAGQFALVDTKLSCLIKGTICNYSEGLGWGFGLGALHIGDMICIGLNSGKATTERSQPVFDYITTALQHAFESRVALVSPNEEIDVNSLPRNPPTDENRQFAHRLLNRDRTNDPK